MPKASGRSTNQQERASCKTLYVNFMSRPFRKSRKQSINKFPDETTSFPLLSQVSQYHWSATSVMAMEMIRLEFPVKACLSLKVRHIDQCTLNTCVRCTYPAVMFNGFSPRY